MLRKLIKYEWKSTSKVGLVLLLAIALATLMGVLTFQAPMWQNISRGSASSGMGGVLANAVSIFSMILYLLLLVGVMYAIIIYLVVRFYRSMYKSEGYLLHTLPVTKHQILTSKIMVSSIWVYLIYLAMLISIVIFFFSMVCAITGESVFAVMESIGYYFSDMTRLLRMVGMLTDTSWSIYMTTSIISVLLGVPTGLIILFGAVSLGQLFSKHRVLMAIVSYICIMVVNWLLGSVIMGVSYAGFSMTGFDQIFEYVHFSAIMGIVVSLIEAAGCYFASFYVISKRLNLE